MSSLLYHSDQTTRIYVGGQHTMVWQRFGAAGADLKELVVKETRLEKITVAYSVFRTNIL